MTTTMSQAAPRRWLLTAFAVLLLLSAGMWGPQWLGGSAGPGVHVWGKVTYQGKPVPAGRIYFSPDFSKKNDGPQGSAEIQGGFFDMRKGGKGAGGGPTIVIIHGFDGQKADKAALGQILFGEHQTTIDLPRENCERHFDVPATR